MVPGDPVPKRLFLVDGSNHAFRVQFALPPQHASDGFPTRVLYGFTLLFQKMIRTFRPDYVAVAFDGGKSFRHDIYPAYKGHRPEMPDDLRRQWPHLADLVRGFGYRVVASPGFEADDVLGTLARRFAGPDVEVFLVTGDKDFCQLVDAHVRVQDDRKGETVDADGTLAWLGVPPNQVVDLLALAGDASDNIPGVPGIGEKTAAKLLSEFGTLEGVLAAAHAGKIAGKRGQSLVDAEADARLSQLLATIRTDVPVEETLDDLIPMGVQEAPLRALFDRWEFGAVARQLLPHRATVDTAGYRVARTEAERRDALAEARAAGAVGVSLRLTSEVVEEAVALGCALAWGSQAPESVVWFPFDTPEAQAEVFALLADPSVVKHAHDLKTILRVVRRQGGDVVQLGEDTRLLDYVLAAHRRTHGLDDLAARHLGHHLTVAPAQESILGGSFQAYAEPAHLALLLHPRLRGRLEPGPAHVYDAIERPLLPVLVRMEEAGILLDQAALDAVLVDVAARVSATEEACHQLLGRPFKVGSPAEVGRVLFEELGLPTGKKTKTGWSTDSSVLEALADQHPLPAAILEWRALQKLESTYLRKLPAYVRADGRIHTTYQQAVAATGRLSSVDPNLQNIPIRTAEGRRIRECFVAAPGCVLVSADYSQVELRVLAHCSQAPALVQSFRAGEDIHRRTAAEVWGVAPEAVSAEQRTAAKAINFGILYGMSAFRLARDLAIPRAEADRYLADYFGRMPEVSAWIEATKAGCRRDGYVETLLGRRRLIPEIDDKDYAVRMAAEREAVNTVVQGTAADLIKIAMIRVDTALHARGLRSRLLLQVHDELLLECPHDEVAVARDLLTEEMMAAAALVVPLAVQVAAGPNWNAAHG
jgi:DNA polymerase-1